MLPIPELIFATNNKHKVEEVAAVLPPGIKVLTLSEAGVIAEMDEPYNTLEANALSKARQIFALTGKNCFAEDSGLEVAALHNEPGVFSARYAGEPRSDKANLDKVLEKLGTNSNRQARFRTVIALVLNGTEYLFEGECPGEIAEAPSGTNGFGYDPIFIPDGFSKTFASMEAAEKNKISHRSKATAKLVAFLYNNPI